MAVGAGNTARRPGSDSFKNGITKYASFFNRQVWVLSLVEVLAVLCIISTTIILVFHTEINFIYWIWFGLTFLLVTLVILVVQRFMIQPTRDIIKMLNDMVNDDGKVISMPSRLSYKASGVSNIIRYIYSLKVSNAILAQKANQKAWVEPTPDFLLQALDDTSVGVVVYDENKEIIYANKTAPVQIGMDDKMLLKLQQEQKDCVENWIDEINEKIIRADKMWQRVPEDSDNSSEKRYYDIVASYSQENEKRTIVIIMDRTDDYKQDNNDLSFIAFAAHELRGPITVIRGYLDVLNDELGGQLSPEYKELINRLIVSANKLSGYINNILNVSKYDQKHMQLILQEDTVSNILNNIMDDIRLRASSQNRLLSVEIPADLPTVAIDISSMGEVFMNLVDNAIKYSREGGLVEVKARVNRQMVEIDVIDHGVGMPANVVQNLFQKFYRSHRSQTVVAGTGIGLYISKAIVDSHGGDISARSVEGVGSTFTVGLPIYESVKEKLLQSNNVNSEFIKQSSGGWIKNHGNIRR